MPRVHCSMKALIHKEKTFLILKQHLPDGSTYWDLPGGRMEVGETPEETLRREVSEETGLELIIGKPLGCFWFFRSDGDQVVCTTFMCTATLENIDLTKNISDESIQEFRWVSKEEFMTEDFPVAHESLKEMIRGF